MSVNNINNSAAQLQLYAQNKTTAVAPKQQDLTAEAKPITSTADTVQISTQARMLYSDDRAVNLLGNGAGIEPPKDPPVKKDII
ncbi:hypothetical protein E0Z06_04725 [Rheinheimera sp. D18]|uniref:hypothetical protein n=1 Tax=Rheinheimera sp. D18 TaxID=2545632 RepID=UPI0010483C12|nr:hypothetical protein [Rheinheimera sp. D18]QBL08863.1 hypothetical protein E0Z06_04725 [Rheinheimera sp. D18]